MAKRPTNYKSDRVAYSTTKATVTYNNNIPGSSIVVPEPQQLGYGEAISSFVPVKPGATFKNWNTLSNGTGYSILAGGAYSVSGDATLYAQWEGTVYTVTVPEHAGYTKYSANYTGYYEDDITFLLTPRSGYNSEDMRVKVGDTTVVKTVGADGKAYSYTVESIKDNITIIVTGVVNLAQDIAAAKEELENKANEDKAAIDAMDNLSDAEKQAAKDPKN